MSLKQFRIRLITLGATFISMKDGDYLDVKIDGKVIVDDKQHEFVFTKGNLTIYNNGYIPHGIPKEAVTQLESHLACYIAGIQARNTISCNVVAPSKKCKKPELEE